MQFSTTRDHTETVKNMIWGGVKTIFSKKPFRANNKNNRFTPQQELTFGLIIDVNILYDVVMEKPLILKDFSKLQIPRGDILETSINSNSKISKLFEVHLDFLG